jgi:SAM-dependent methyltransferase
MTARTKSGIQVLKPLVPVAIKRPLKRVIPRRYHRFFDPEWHRRGIGNLPRWEEMGDLQFEYLVRHGLERHHCLLDVGCGPLRGGIHFIRYLEPGRYFGVDKNGPVLEEARRVEVPRHGVADKRPTLVAMESFDFPRLGQTFDYALAQSVFTHLDVNQIIRCVMQMEKVLVAGGRFFATIWENPEGKRNLDDIRQTERKVTHFDADSYHYDVGTFEWICKGTSLSVERLGPWGHPDNQIMLVFTKQPASGDARRATP